MASTNPARGMRDFLPADIRKRNYVIGIIKEVYESYGFEPLETPAVENLDTLMGKYGDEGNQLVFKILKRGEKLDFEHATSESDLSDLALRYDLTVPLARVVANNKNDLPKFFKRYQIQPVWRADRPARGRFREFYQCDVDAIGSSSMVIEAELISAISEILLRLGFDDFKIRLNNRHLLTGILNAAGIPSERHIEALVALDKLDKIQFSGVREEFEKLGLSKESLGKVEGLYLELFEPQGYDELALRIEQFLGAEKAQYESSVLETIELFSLFDAYGLDSRLANTNNRILYYDVTLARGLSYYTGAIMEIDVGKEIGSLGGGGRYDGLIGMFGKEQIPACGFSLGLERILVVMDERGMFPPEIAESTPADVMVTIWSEETIGESLKLASELRSDGLRVTIYPEPDKLGKQVKYADSIKVPFVCILGESEITGNNVTLKDMKAGEQVTIRCDEASKTIVGRLQN